MAERLPPGVYESEEMRPVYLPNGNESHFIDHSSLNREHWPNSESNGPNMPLSSTSNPNHTNGFSTQNFASEDAYESNELSTISQNHGLVDSHGTEEHLSTREHANDGDMVASSGKAVSLGSKGPEHLQNGENGSKSRSPTSNSNQVEAEWIEQYEPGVYITLMALRDGTRDLKRVRFR